MSDQIIGNQVYSQSKSQYIQAWLVALTWNGMIFFAIFKGYQHILQAFEHNPIFYFFVSFPFIGLWLLIDAIKKTITWFKFGKTPITLDPFPGQIGGQCAGYLLLPGLKAKIDQAVFTLTYIHRYARSDNQGKTHWHEDILWQDRASFKAEHYGKLTRINFQFNPPANLPETEKESQDYHYWQCHVHLDLPGIDYDRAFNIPMKAVGAERQSSARQYATPAATRISHQDTEVARIPETHTSATGLSLYFGYGRAKGMALFCLLTGLFIGLFIGIFGYYFFSGIEEFLPATTALMAGYVGLIAFILCLFGILLVANCLTIEVNLKGIRKKQHIFGFLLSEFINADDIVDIACEQHASSSSGHHKRVWYRLKVLTKQGAEMEIGDSLEGQSYAKEIRQKIIDALGASWRPATPEPQSKKTKAKKPVPGWLRLIGKILSFSFIIAFLADIIHFFPELQEFLGINF